MAINATIVAVALGGALIGYLYILFAVVLKSVERKPSQERTISEFLRAMLFVLLTLILILPAALLTSITLMGNHVYSNWPLYAGLATVVLAADMISDFHKQILETYDKVNTEFWVPIYRGGFITTDNIVRIFYDITICWWNLFQQLFNIMFQETIRILLRCTIIDWEEVSRAIVTLMEAPYESLILFIADGGEERFDLEAVWSSGGVLLGALFDIGECSCEELGFFWNWAKEIVQSSNLHKALDRYGNLPADWIRPGIKFLAELFTNIPNPFTCPPSGQPRLDCQLLREPKLDMFFDDATEGIKFTGFWIDDILRATLDIFFDYTSFFSADTVPSMGFYFGVGPNWALRVVEISIDMITHVDLIFTSNYLLHVNFTKPAEELFCLSLGFEDFWFRIGQGAGVPEMTGLGTGTAKLFNSTLETYIFWTKLSQIALFDPLSLLDFTQEYDYNLIFQQYADGWADIVAFIRFLDVELGDFALFRVRREYTWFQFWINVFVHIPTLTAGSDSEINDLQNDILSPLIEQYREESRNYAAAAGNVIRQIGQFLPVESCPLVPLTAPESVTDAFEDKEFFCCVGDLIHSLLLLQTEASITILEFFEQIVDARAGTITLLAALDTVVDRYERIISRADGMIESFGCLYYSFFFNYVECPNLDGVTNLLNAFPTTQTLFDPSSAQISNFLRRPITDVLNITLITSIRLQRIVIICMRDLVEDNYSASAITRFICCLIVGIYDTSVGIISKITQSTINLFVCLVPGGFFGDVSTNFIIWDLFGWDGLSDGNPNNVINLRDEICEVIDAILILLEFFVTIVNAADQFFLDAIEFLTSLFVDGLEAAFEAIEEILLNAISDVIDLIFSEIQAVTDFIKGPVEDKVNDAIIFINNNLVVAINTLVCSIFNIVDDIAACFLSETFTIDISIPEICIDFPFGIGQRCFPGFSEQFEVPDPFAMAVCIGNIDPYIFNCPPTIGDVPLVNFCKRSDLSDAEFYKRLSEKTIRPSKAARRGDPDGLIMLLSDPEPEHVKLARKEKFNEVRQLRKSYKIALRNGDLERFEMENRNLFDNLLQQNASITQLNLKELKTSQPCYKYAVWVFGSSANYSSDGTLYLPFNTSNEMNQVISDRFRIFNSQNDDDDERLINVDDMAVWATLSRGVDDFLYCYTTTSIIRYMNFQLGLSSVTAIPEDIIFRPLIGITSALRATRTLTQILTYQYRKSNVTTFNSTSLGEALNQNITFEEFYNSSIQSWDNWTNEKNITDPTTLEWGRIVDRFRFFWDLFGTDQFSKLGDGINSLLRFLRVIFYELPRIVTGVTFPLPPSPGKMEGKKRFTSSGYFEADKSNVTWSDALNIIGLPYHRIMDNGGNDLYDRVVNWTGDFLYNNTISKDPRIIRNRLALFRISKVVRNTVRNNILNRNFNNAERFLNKWSTNEKYIQKLVVDLTIDGRTTTNERREKLDEQFEKRDKNYKSNQTIYFERDTFGGLIDPVDLNPCLPENSGPQLCLDCILLDRFVERIVFEICECITASVDIVNDAFSFENTLGKWGGDPADVQFPSTYPRSGNDPNILPLKRHDGSLFIPEFDERDNSSNIFRQEMNDYKNDIISRFKTVTIIPSPFSLNKLTVNLIFAIPRLLFSGVNFDTLLDDIASFFTNPDILAKDNIYRLIAFSFRCRGQNYKCQVNPDGEGIGFVNAAIFVPTVLLILSLILPRIFGSTRIPLTFAWGALPAIILSLAYYWIPGCGFTLPNCAMDDFHDVLTYFDVDCTPWHIWLPGLTTPICPTEFQDFTRIFPDCTAPPYNFNDGFRNLFLSLELVWPGFNEYVRTTSNLLVNWIVAIDHLNQAMTFPFPPGEVPDDFKSCNKITFGNFAPIAIYGTFGFIAFGALAYATFLLFTAIITFFELFFDAIAQGVAAGADPKKSSRYAGLDSEQFRNYASGKIPVNPPTTTLPTTVSSSSMRQRTTTFVHDKNN